MEFVILQSASHIARLHSWCHYGDFSGAVGRWGREEGDLILAISNLRPAFEESGMQC